MGGVSLRISMKKKLLVALATILTTLILATYILYVAYALNIGREEGVWFAHPVFFVVSPFIGAYLVSMIQRIPYNTKENREARRRLKRQRKAERDAKKRFDKNRGEAMRKRKADKIERRNTRHLLTSSTP